MLMSRKNPWIISVVWYNNNKFQTREEDMAKTKAKKAKCAAKTKEGKRCKKDAVGKSKYCATHRKK